MRALTVHQPWAWAIVHGGKDVENRTQAWGYRGPLAIHAGQRWSERGEWSPLVKEAIRQHEWPEGVDPFPMGAIIGVVDLVEVHRNLGNADSVCCDSPWAEAAYAEHGGRTRREIVHLVLANPRPLIEPVRCRGAQGLWTVPVDVMLQMVNQCGPAAGELLGAGQ